VISASPIDLVGYDARIAGSLPESSRRQIEWLAEGYLLSAFMLIAPIGYAVWLIQHSLLAAFLSAAFAWCVILAVLRLLTSGGGAAPHMNDSEVRAHSPTLIPMLLWFFLAVIFAQIAQLPVFQRELNASVSAHRIELMAKHNAARELLGAEIHPEYGDDIARCEFLMFRMQQLWQRPGRTLVLTAAYVVLAISPFVFAFLFARETLRNYHLAKVAEIRGAIVRETQRAEAQRQRLLRPFSSEVAAPHYVDAPFNRRVRTPLLMPMTFAANGTSGGPSKSR
jgi:hypothetical protein